MHVKLPVYKTNACFSFTYLHGIGLHISQDKALFGVNLPCQRRSESKFVLINLLETQTSLVLQVNPNLCIELLIIMLERFFVWCFDLMLYVYENTPMQYTAILHGCKNCIFFDEKNVIYILTLLKTLILGTR